MPGLVFLQLPALIDLAPLVAGSFALQAVPSQLLHALLGALACDLLSRLVFSSRLQPRAAAEEHPYPSGLAPNCRQYSHLADLQVLSLCHLQSRAVDRGLELVHAPQQASRPQCRVVCV